MNNPLPEIPDSVPCGRVGFVTLLGRPNTGKSTLINHLLDFHLAAVSSKPQTTRRTWLGIRTDEDSQMLFLDAPGVHMPEHALDEVMDRAVARALEDADVVVCLADATRGRGTEDAMVAARAAESGKPVLLAINKVDIATADGLADTRAFYAERVRPVETLEISATTGTGVDALLAAVKRLLPEGPFVHAADTFTDVYERDIGAELIRETLLDELRDEVPHSMTVTIEAWREGDKRTCVDATLHVERQGQKGIVIGREGVMINRIRRAATTKLIELCGRPVTLKLYVKVSSDWRSKPGSLRSLNILD